MSGRKPSPAKLPGAPAAKTSRGAHAAEAARFDATAITPVAAKTGPAKRVSAKTASAEPAAKSADITPVTARNLRANDASGAARKLAADIEAALSRGEAELLSQDAIQAVMAAACRAYAARVEAGDSFPPLAPRSPVTSTDVMVTASGLLKSANLAVFELGMWQSWTGR